MENWKTKLRLGDCDALYDEYVDEVEIPFVPRIGEKFWCSEEAEDKLTDVVKKCWRNNRCDDCPYIYCARKSENDCYACDAITVTNIIYAVDEKAVIVSLSKNPQNY